MIKNPKIIIYDDENMTYIVGYIGWYDMGVSTMDVTIPNDYMYCNAVSTHTFHCDINEAKTLDNIQLDPTTMKRIAKFNKEQEIRRLDEEINKKKEKIKELDDILQDKDKRVEKLKEFVANIYNIDINDDEEDYDDYDDFYY